MWHFHSTPAFRQRQADHSRNLVERTDSHLSELESLGRVRLDRLGNELISFKLQIPGAQESVSNFMTVKNQLEKPGVMVHTCIPSTGETEAGD